MSNWRNILSWDVAKHQPGYRGPEVKFKATVVYDMYGTQPYSEVRTDWGTMQAPLSDLFQNWDLSTIDTWDESDMIDIFRDFVTEDPHALDVEDSSYDDYESGDSQAGGENFNEVESVEPPEGFDTWMDLLTFVKQQHAQGLL